MVKVKTTDSKKEEEEEERGEEEVGGTKTFDFMADYAEFQTSASEREKRPRLQFFSFTFRILLDDRRSCL